MSGRTAVLISENERLRRYVEEAGVNAERALALIAERDAECTAEVGRSRAQAAEAVAALARVQRTATSKCTNASRIDVLQERLRSMEARLHKSKHAVTRLRSRYDQQRVLMAELSHRLKNSLALVQGMVDQTLRHSSSTAMAKETLTARVVALGRAHGLLIEESWSGANIRRIVATTLGPHGDCGEAGRFRVNGPSVRICAQQTMALSLALHELCTNAVKHGALSTEGGWVSVTWQTVRQNDGRWLSFCWSEHDGPIVSHPAKSGFGSRLIERSLVAALGGEISLRFEPHGVVCDMAALLQPER